jgi:hypothetical protein
MQANFVRLTIPIHNNNKKLYLPDVYLRLVLMEIQLTWSYDKHTVSTRSMTSITCWGIMALSWQIVGCSCFCTPANSTLSSRSWGQAPPANNALKVKGLGFIQQTLTEMITDRCCFITSQAKRKIDVWGSAHCGLQQVAPSHHPCS